LKCPLCGYDFDPAVLDCREAGCPLAGLQGCMLICCPNCGYQMPDKRGSALAGLLERLQEHFSRRAQTPPGPEAETGAISIRELKPGQSAVVTELRFTDCDRLDQLCTYGLAPGCSVQLEQTQPVVILRVGGTTLSVDYEVADGILVCADEPGPAPQVSPVGNVAQPPQ
jgi:Fe2+ transport system protein FeoA